MMDVRKRRALRSGAWPLLTAAWVALVAMTTASPGLSEEPTVEELLLGIDDLFRGTSSHGTMTMKVRTERWQRELKMEMWSRGTDKTLVRIVEPLKERGTATLMVGDDIWNYLPKIDRTIRVPASMMSGSWMGSHMTNDDIVSGSRFEEDYACAFAVDDDVNAAAHWLISCEPRPEAPIVWGEVTLRIRRSGRLVQEVRYLDEKRELVRAMTFDEPFEIEGRLIPRRTRVVPADDPEEFTEMYYEVLEFDVELPDSMFSLQSLRR